MRTNRVIVFQPAFSFFADLDQSHEAPGIEDSVTVDSVEAHDERVLGALAGLSVFNADVALLTPSDQGRALEFRTVVDPTPYFERHW